MKKRILSLLITGVLFLALSFNVYAGGRSQNQNQAQNQSHGNVLTVGATPVPHAALLNLIKDDLAAQGITLRIEEFTDYLMPNMALVSGDLDANFFQHVLYLESNADWAAKLVSAFGVHIEPLGLYSTKYGNISELPNGATIAIPNDPSNGERALRLLQANGLITLRSGLGTSVTLRDIADNPKNLRFRELEAAMLPRSLDDVDAAAINGNYALAAGLDPLKDSLIIEDSESPYVNIVAVRRGSEQDARIIALKNALLSPKVKNFINNTYNGGVVAAF